MSAKRRDHMINKTIVLSLVTVCAVAAQAGSIQDSVTGSSKASTSVVEGSSTAVGAVSNGIISAVEKSGKGLAKVGNASVFVIEHPSDASEMSVDASGKASTYVLTTSGKVLTLTIDGSKTFIADTSASTSAAGNKSVQFIEVKLDKSGTAIAASGKSTYELVKTTSGEIYTVSKGSVVASYEGSKGALTYVSETSVLSVQTSANDISRMLEIASEMPANSFAASKQSGRQNDEK